MVPNGAPNIASVKHRIFLKEDVFHWFDIENSPEYCSLMTKYNFSLLKAAI